MLKTLHLLLATLLLGAEIFNYLLICITKDQENLSATLKISIKIDWVIIFLLALMFLSGTIIVPIYHWNYQTPWIIAAYIFLSLAIALWITNIYLKKLQLRQRSHPVLFHSCNIGIILTLIVIIKDAVTKQTWL